ncbi:MAG: UDP-3-O-acyl-N-acetylglucosamine deacetylase [Pirellulales bacterium]
MSTTTDRVALSTLPFQSESASSLPATSDGMQHSIAAPAVVTGFGFWSGKDVRVEFRPAPAGSGVSFVRTDLSTPVRIPAKVDCRIEVPRRTTLSHKSVTVEMVEHVLAALAGLGIDNCEIWVDQSELPGCDGSSLPFVNALIKAGIVAQSEPRPQLFVREVTRVGNADQWIEARPAEGVLSIRYRLDYSGTSTAIGRQTNEFVVTPQVFRTQLASSRTFMLEEEAKWLLAQGLGTRVKPTDVLVFGDSGPIENEQRFEDECVRHKILDVIGDLALGGCQVVGAIVAHRSGHRLNAELVRALLTEGEIVKPQRKTA